MVYVPPKYPSDIPSLVDLPDRQDDIDWLYAARYNELKKELRAALTELGTLPKGAFADVKTRLDDVPIKSGCYAYLSIDQSINTGSTTKVNWNREQWDILGEYDRTTNYRFVADNAGYYLVIAQIFWVGTDVVANKEWHTRIRKNEVTELQNRAQSAVAGSGLSVIASGILKLNANDNIDVVVYQNSGAAAEIDNDITVSSLMIQRLA